MYYEGLKRSDRNDIFSRIVCSAGFFVQLVNAEEGRVVVYPTDDSYVDFDNQEQNYGLQSTLVVEKFQDSFENTWETIVWLKFNLSDVPDGALVDVATLELHSYSATETYDVSAHSCSDNSWTESTLKYSNMPIFNATQMSSTLVSSSSQWYSWNVIDSVQTAVDGIHGGLDVVTIVLLETSFRSLLSHVQFWSKDGATLQSPKLTIHWSNVVPEFPSFLILPLFMIATLLAVIIYRRKHSIESMT